MNTEKSDWNQDPELVHCTRLGAVRSKDLARIVDAR